MQKECGFPAKNGSGTFFVFVLQNKMYMVLYKNINGRKDFIMKQDYLKRALTHPGEYQDVEFWAYEHGITKNQINDAILHTGTLDVFILRQYLKEHGVILYPFQREWRLLKNMLVAFYKRIAGMFSINNKKSVLNRATNG